MFIVVKFGNNEELLCNPSCAVVNLLNSIKRRAGYSNTTVCLDLSDETGLVKELDGHQQDSASKHLSSHGTYVLVEKQVLPNEEDSQDGGLSPPPPNIQYVPLLDNYTELFPDYRLHVVNKEISKHKKRRAMSKSPSPAGIRGIRGKHAKATKSSSKKATTKA